MKNVTVSVPDAVYRAARIRAAERGTSLSAIVAEYLTTLSNDDGEFETLEKQQRRIVSRIKQFSASDRLERAELYDRAIR